MKPETTAFLQKAQEFLDKAQAMVAMPWPDEAGRAAYLAGFHAAQALIFERQGRALKTHSGVQAEFARLVKDDPRFDLALRRFLGRAYNLKAVADYETGPGSHIAPEQATEAIQTARHFLDTVREVLSDTGATRDD